MYQYYYSSELYPQYSHTLNMYQPFHQYIPDSNVYQSMYQYTSPQNLYESNHQYTSTPTIPQAFEQIRSTSNIQQLTQTYSPIPIVQKPLQHYNLTPIAYRPTRKFDTIKNSRQVFPPLISNSKGSTSNRNQLSQSSSGILSRHCQTIKTKANNISTTELQHLLDEIQHEFDNVKDTKQHTKNIRTFVLTLISVKLSILTTVKHHNVFHQLRPTLIHLLRQWRRQSTLSENDVFLFRSIIKLTTKLLKHVGEINQYPFWLFNPVLLEMIASCLTDISKSAQFINENNKRESRSFIRLFTLYIKYQTDIEKEKATNKDVLIQLIDPTVQCLTSNYYIDAVSKIKTNDKLMKIRAKFFLHKCPIFLTAYNGPRIEYIMEGLLSTMSPQYLTILNDLIPSIHQWKPSTMQAVNQLIKLINHGPSTSKLLATHLPIIDHVLTIVDTSLLYNKLVENLSNPETVLMNTAVHFLADMVNEPTILAHIKQKKLTSSFLRLISAPYEPLVHDIYAILALTTSEKDINEMQNPSLLLSPVVRSLKEAVFNYKSDDQTQVLQFLNTLKGLVQHEQIKEEILKKDIFSSLLEWTKNFTGDILTVLLETIWALSFSHSGTLELRKHPEFLEKIQTIAQSASSEELKKASEGLVWKLVQEPAFLEKAEQKRKEQDENMVEEDIETTEVVIGPDGKEQIVKKIRRVSIAPAEQTFQYDMMISYCHADKDLIYKIHKFLLDQGFKIWIDLNNMFGPAMSAMAEAVENSEFVLICMSDSYKQSTYCQAEAEYAFGCKRRLLPLIVRPGYKADGWLGFMMGSRIYIDFGRFDFDTGCDKLMNEIALQRKRPLPSKESKVGQHEKPDDKIPTITITTEKSSPSLTPSPRSPTPPSISGKLPDIYMKRSASFQYRLKPIHQWIESDVLDFLYSNQIQEFMPVCEKMDGRALIQLYKMSVSHSKSTYVLLNDELKSTHQVRLPIGSFTRFLSIMERVAGSYLQSSLSITPIKEQPQITTTTITTAPPTEPYSSMLPLPAPIHLQETHQNNSTPSYYRQSNFPYDILVTSNASASELLKMADRFILKYMR